MLTNLDGLTALTNITGNLIINNNATLANIDGLSGLNTVTGFQGGEIYIRFNPLLTNINALSSIIHISAGNYGGLTIRDNSILTNVDGLSSLTSITGGGAPGYTPFLTVVDNPLLNNGCGLFPLLNVNGVGGCTGSTVATCTAITISGNGPGFTRESILAGGICTNLPALCLGDLNLTSQAEVNAFTSTHKCKEIKGYLSISGSDITNLDSLYVLQKVSGSLIIYSNSHLNNIDGLRELISVGERWKLLIMRYLLTWTVYRSLQPLDIGLYRTKA